MTTIDDLTFELYFRLKGGFDLRYTGFPSPTWCVMVSLGNCMIPVPDSIRPTMEESLRAAIERWDTRSSQYPFTQLRGYFPGDPTREART